MAPSYKIPSVTTLKNALDTKYEVTKEILKSGLLATPHVSIIFDAWTETMNENSFLGVTVQYLKDITIKSHCLAVANLKERYTAQYICEILDTIFSDWQIDKNKIVTVVTDNGANVVAAVNKTFGKSRHTPCFAHTINLVATHTVGPKNMKPIERVVLELIHSIWNEHREIYFDNYFSSLPLVQKLKLENTLACGTIRPNRKGLPTEMCIDKQMKRGEHDNKFLPGGISFFKWMDNKAVHFISNFHGSEVSICKQKRKAWYFSFSNKSNFGRRLQFIHGWSRPCQQITCII